MSLWVPLLSRHFQIHPFPLMSLRYKLIPSWKGRQIKQPTSWADHAAHFAFWQIHHEVISKVHEIVSVGTKSAALRIFLFSWFYSPTHSFLWESLCALEWQGEETRGQGEVERREEKRGRTWRQNKYVIKITTSIKQADKTISFPRLTPKTLQPGAQALVTIATLPPNMAGEHGIAWVGGCARGSQDGMTSFPQHGAIKLRSNCHLWPHLQTLSHLRKNLQSLV